MAHISHRYRGSGNTIPLLNLGGSTEEVSGFCGFLKRHPQLGETQRRSHVSSASFGG